MDKRSSPSHDPGTRKGEEMPGSESGRRQTGRTQTGRPTGSSGARFSTGINPQDEEPIMPDSPDLPPA
jgi:hypothetical protein